MTTYSKLTDYAAKDALLTGNPSKKVRGTELGAEFDAIAAADADSIKTGALAASGGSNLVGFLQSGTGATARTVQSRLRDTVSVKDFGAVGDGVTDDTAAIQAAEAVAYSNGCFLVFPSGGTYCQDGTLAYRCSIYGYGATVKNTVAAEVSGYNGSVIKTGATSNIYVLGLTVDCDNKSVAFGASGATQVIYRDCKAVNCKSAGFTAYSSSYITYDNCKALAIGYITSGAQADGFYSAGGIDVSYLNCHAEDFSRIGFVSEGDGTTDSYRTNYYSCVATNGHDCDTSAAEYNAGFWAENTNGMVIDCCSVTDIAGNSGQTSGRVAGICLNNTGDTIESVAAIINTSIGDSSGTMPHGVRVAGSANLANVVVQNTVIRNYNTGVITLGGINSLSISNLLLRNGTYAVSSNGGVVIDCNGTVMAECNINSVSESSATYTNPASATIKVYRAPTSGTLNVTNCSGITLNTHATTGYAKAKITSCDISVTDANYSMVEATETISISDSTITRTNSGPVVLFGGSSSGGANCRVHVTNTRFDNFDNISVVRGNNYIINGNTFNNCSIYWVPESSGCFMKLDGNFWRNAGAQHTAVSINGTSGNTVVHFTGNTFNMGNIAWTPVIYATTQPAYVYLQSNAYFTTNLSDLVGSVKNEQTYNLKLV